MKIFLSPHTDDEALFGAFTILREQPLVVVALDGYVQEKRGVHVTAVERRKETQKAMDILGAEVKFLGVRDDSPDWRLVGIEMFRLNEMYKPEMVYAPASELNGHPHHNQIGEQALLFFPHVTHYMTYTPAGKSRSSREVKIEHGSWIGKKLRALACYESQHSLDPRMGCWPHFMRDLTEYYAV